MRRTALILIGLLIAMGHPSNKAIAETAEAAIDRKATHNWRHHFQPGPRANPDLPPSLYVSFGMTGAIVDEVLWDEMQTLVELRLRSARIELMGDGTLAPLEIHLDTRDLGDSVLYYEITARFSVHIRCTEGEPHMEVAWSRKRVGSAVTRTLFRTGVRGQVTRIADEFANEYLKWKAVFATEKAAD